MEWRGNGNVRRGSGSEGRVEMNYICRAATVIIERKNFNAGPCHGFQFRSLGPSKRRPHKRKSQHRSPDPQYSIRTFPPLTLFFSLTATATATPPFSLFFCSDPRPGHIPLRPDPLYRPLTSTRAMLCCCCYLSSYRPSPLSEQAFARLLTHHQLSSFEKMSLGATFIWFVSILVIYSAHPV